MEAYHHHSCTCHKNPDDSHGKEREADLNQSFANVEERGASIQSPHGHATPTREAPTASEEPTTADETGKSAIETGEDQGEEEVESVEEGTSS